MTEQFIQAVRESWENREGNVNSTPEIFSWIRDLNANTCVRIEECSIDDCSSWLYDSEHGRIVSRSGKFFSITGMRWIIDGVTVSEQPVIIQPEIGYLSVRRDRRSAELPDAGKDRAGQCKLCSALAYHTGYTKQFHEGPWRQGADISGAVLGSVEMHHNIRPHPVRAGIEIPQKEEPQQQEEQGGNPH